MKCIEDEIPFELPEGWEWCRFTSVTVNRDSERKPISSANRTNVAKIYDYYGASGKIDKIDKFIFNAGRRYCCKLNRDRYFRAYRLLP